MSRRTISRDIETLCRAGIPIRTVQGAGGGISIMESYRMDRTLLTSKDMQILRTADGKNEAGSSPRQAPLTDLSNEQIFPAGMQARVLFDPDMKWRLTEEFGPHSFETRADGRLIFD